MREQRRRAHPRYSIRYCPVTFARDTYYVSESCLALWKVKGDARKADCGPRRRSVSHDLDDSMSLFLLSIWILLNPTQFINHLWLQEGLNIKLNWLRQPRKQKLHVKDLRIFGDSSVTVAQWIRPRNIIEIWVTRYPQVPGSIPAEDPRTQINIDLS